MELINRKVHSYTTSDILEGIKKHDSNVLNFIYRKYFNEIRQYIIKNNGGEDDAKDIFQEGIIVLYRKIKDEKLNLTCSVNTYFYSICRYLWLKQLNKQKLDLSDDYNIDENIEIDDDFELLVLENEKFKLYQEHFIKLPDDCKKLLKLFIENLSIKEIAQQMDFTENYTKKRKFMCKEYLVNNVQNDPKYKELL